MLVLALDTATSDLVTGVVDTATGAVTESVLVETRAHNEKLIPTTTALLDRVGVTYADLGAIVVGCGPGPFTGLRVGMSTAQALGLAAGVPVHGVCSLDAIAHGSRGRVLVATDARRKEVYWGTYLDGRRVEGPAVNKPEDLAAEVDSLIFPADIAPRLPQALASLPRTQANPRPAQLVAVAELDCPPKPLVPLYLRRPDAIAPQAKPVSPALSWGS